MNTIEVEVSVRACYLGAEGKVFRLGDRVLLPPLQALESLEGARVVLVNPGDMDTLREARAKETRRQLIELRRAPDLPVADPRWQRAW